MVYGDEFGDEAPDWYVTIAAARYANMDPVSFEELPLKKRAQVIGAMNMEAQAAEKLRNKT